MHLYYAPLQYKILVVSKLKFQIILMELESEFLLNIQFNIKNLFLNLKLVLFPLTLVVSLIVIYP